jgi:hypothetical protein
MQSGAAGEGVTEKAETKRGVRNVCYERCVIDCSAFMISMPGRFMPFCST